MNKQPIEQLKELDNEIIRLEEVCSLLEWDEEIHMPTKAIGDRSEQITLLRGMVYDRKTSDRVGELLDLLAVPSQETETQRPMSDADKAIVRLYKRDYERQKRVPRSLVTALSSVQSRAQAVWAKAREDSSFSDFQPYLEQIIDLKRQWAEAVGYEEHPYDPLLDEYEPGMTTREVDTLFSDLSQSLRELIEQLGAASTVDDSFLYLDYPKEKQELFGRTVLSDMGIDFSRFVLTESVHPFTTALGADDVRITTRYNEASVSNPLFSTIHEGGHALYELGAASKLTRNSILSQGTSLSVHESQSRLWENMIGRSLPFWQHYYPVMKELFPKQLSGVTLEHFLRAVNKVEPSMIRVNADEVTYSLHVILRFQLEKELITGNLSVANLPEAWNEQMKQLLGICPRHDSEGVLQDVHWSAGLFGYFPTYALGNLFGAQFYRSMEADKPGLDAEIAAGNLSAARDWLDDHLYQYGSIYPAKELLQRVTGDQLDAEHYVRYLTDKYLGLFGSSEEKE
ncbi:MAG: carboxypeptidase M32 [Spirochaetota bacterium]